MYKEVLQSIDHVAIWPVISFVIFFLFFLMLLWWTFTANTVFMKEMAQKPLEDAASDHKNTTKLPI
jgi:beta-lactam-binding protein with PASTA domain